MFKTLINAHWPARKQKQSMWCRRPFRPELPLTRSRPRSPRSQYPKLALAEQQRHGSGNPGLQGRRRGAGAGRTTAVHPDGGENSFLGPSRVQVPAGLQELTLKLPIERVAGGKVTAGDTVGVFLSLERGRRRQGGQAKSSKTQLSFHKVLVTAAQFSNGTATQTGESGHRIGNQPGVVHVASSKAQTRRHLPHYHRQELGRRRTDRLRRGVRQGLPVQGTRRCTRSRERSYVDTAGLFR